MSKFKQRKYLERYAEGGLVKALKNRQKILDAAEKKALVPMAAAPAPMAPAPSAQPAVDGHLPVGPVNEEVAQQALQVKKDADMATRSLGLRGFANGDVVEGSGWSETTDPIAKAYMADRIKEANAVSRRTDFENMAVNAARRTGSLAGDPKVRTGASLGLATAKGLAGMEVMPTPLTIGLGAMAQMKEAGARADSPFIQYGKDVERRRLLTKEYPEQVSRAEIRGETPLPMPPGMVSGRIHDIGTPARGPAPVEPRTGYIPLDQNFTGLRGYADGGLTNPGYGVQPYQSGGDPAFRNSQRRDSSIPISSYPAPVQPWHGAPRLERIPGGTSGLADMVPRGGITPYTPTPFSSRSPNSPASGAAPVVAGAPGVTRTGNAYTSTPTPVPTPAPSNTTASTTTPAPLPSTPTTPAPTPTPAPAPVQRADWAKGLDLHNAGAMPTVGQSMGSGTEWNKVAVNPKTGYPMLADGGQIWGGPETDNESTRIHSPIYKGPGGKWDGMPMLANGGAIKQWNSGMGVHIPKGGSAVMTNRQTGQRITLKRGLADGGSVGMAPARGHTVGRRHGMRALLADGGQVNRANVDDGMIFGDGGPTEDKQPIMASPGEFIIPADSTDAIGRNKLRKMVAATHTPVHLNQGLRSGYADGDGINFWKRWPRGTDAWRDLNQRAASIYETTGGKLRGAAQGLRSAAQPTVDAVRDLMPDSLSPEGQMARDAAARRAAQRTASTFADATAENVARTAAASEAQAAATRAAAAAAAPAEGLGARALGGALGLGRGIAGFGRMMIGPAAMRANVGLWAATHSKELTEPTDQAHADLEKQTSHSGLRVPDEINQLSDREKYLLLKDANSNDPARKQAAMTRLQGSNPQPYDPDYRPPGAYKPNQTPEQAKAYTEQAVKDAQAGAYPDQVSRGLRQAGIVSPSSPKVDALPAAGTDATDLVAPAGGGFISGIDPQTGKPRLASYTKDTLPTPMGITDTTSPEILAADKARRADWTAQSQAIDDKNARENAAEGLRLQASTEQGQLAQSRYDRSQAVKSKDSRAYMNAMRSEDEINKAREFRGLQGAQQATQANEMAKAKMLAEAEKYRTDVGAVSSKYTADMGWNKALLDAQRVMDERRLAQRATNLKSTEDYVDEGTKVYMQDPKNPGGPQIVDPVATAAKKNDWNRFRAGMVNNPEFLKQFPGVKSVDDIPRDQIEPIFQQFTDSRALAQNVKTDPGDPALQGLPTDVNARKMRLGDAISFPWDKERNAIGLGEAAWGATGRWNPFVMPEKANILQIGTPGSPTHNVRVSDVQYTPAQKLEVIRMLRVQGKNQQAEDLKAIWQMK